MANTIQAKKRIRQNVRRAATNKARVSRIRTFIRKVEDAVAAGDKDAASAALVAAQPEIMRGATKGVLHKKTASRKVRTKSERLDRSVQPFFFYGGTNRASVGPLD